MGGARYAVLPCPPERPYGKPLIPKPNQAASRLGVWISSSRLSFAAFPTYYCGKHFEKPRIRTGGAAILEDQCRKGLWRLHLPRNCAHVNSHLVALAIVLGANTDCQPILTAKGVADYMCKYITKYGAGQSVTSRIAFLLDDIVSHVPESSMMTIASLLTTAGPLQSLKPPKAHKLFKFTESTQALKARKRTRGPNEITIQNKAPWQCPGNTPSSKGSGMAPGPCLGAQRRKIRLFKTIDLGEVIYKELATRL